MHAVAAPRAQPLGAAVGVSVALAPGHHGELAHGEVVTLDGGRRQGQPHSHVGYGHPVLQQVRGVYVGSAAWTVGAGAWLLMNGAWLR